MSALNMRTVFFSAVIGFLMMQPALAAGAMPTGATVVKGDVAVTAPSATEMTVTQTSAAGVVDWSGFSIGSGNTVQFNNGTGATLNRVTGPTVTSIDGTLSATGSVYIINQNGVIVGQSGIVNVGGSFGDVSDIMRNATTRQQDAMLAVDKEMTGNPANAVVVAYGKVGSVGKNVNLIATNDNGSREVLMHDTSVANGKLFVKSESSVKAADARLRAADGDVYRLAGNTNGYAQGTDVTRSGGRIFLTAAN